MSELPEKFTAKDPVTGRDWVCELTKHCVRPGWEPVVFVHAKEVNEGGHQMSAGPQPELVRALIQYGRDLERAEIEKALKVDHEVQNMDPGKPKSFNKGLSCDLCYGEIPDSSEECVTCLVLTCRECDVAHRECGV